MTQASDDRTVTLDVASRFEMLDVVQTVLLQCCAIVGFDEEAVHYMSVAVRESVVNAIKHGNKHDEAKRVHVRFTIHDKALEVQVGDQGQGFDPAAVLDPLAPENLLRAYGRGILDSKQLKKVATADAPVLQRLGLPSLEEGDDGYLRFRWEGQKNTDPAIEIRDSLTAERQAVLDILLNGDTGDGTRTMNELYGGLKTGSVDVLSDPDAFIRWSEKESTIMAMREEGGEALTNLRLHRNRAKQARKLIKMIESKGRLEPAFGLCLSSIHRGP